MCAHNIMLFPCSSCCEEQKIISVPNTVLKLATAQFFASIFNCEELKKKGIIRLTNAESIIYFFTYRKQYVCASRLIYCVIDSQRFFPIKIPQIKIGVLGKLMYFSTKPTKKSIPVGHWLENCPVAAARSLQVPQPETFP